MDSRYIFRVVKVLLLLLSFIITLHSSNLSIVSNKVIHDNGLKEFVIVKDIKKNNCTCLCNCVPNAVLADIGQPLVPSIPPEYQSSAENKKCMYIYNIINKSTF